jgi:5-methyltetrahydrofolate--homocysteine methyltransferase
MARIRALYDAIVNGDAKASVALAGQALAEGRDPMEIVSDSMIAAMDEVARRFECGDYFVPELLLSARAMKGALELVRPLLAARGEKPVAKVVIGTVKGDLHDIAKNLVSSMLEGGGFEVHDLGADVPPERFVSAIREHGADLLALSALLTVTMPSMRQTSEVIRNAGIRDKVKIMVGGAPLTSQFAAEIGADGYSDNASAAVALARNLVLSQRA